MFDFFKRRRRIPQLPYTTEVHCHILPGIDDGARDVAHAIQLVYQMKEWGVEKIVATPHVTEASFENTPQTIEAAQAQLRQEIDLGKLGIELCHSAEYRMDDNFLGILERNEIIPMLGNHILIENSFLQPFWNIKGLVFDLQMKGLSPILAHPERYAYYYEEKNIYTELHEQGCEFQVNILSLAGYYNKRAKEIAEWLISKHMVDYLGSDLHNNHHAQSISKYLSGKEFIRHMRNIHLKNNAL